MGAKPRPMLLRMFATYAAVLLVMVIVFVALYARRTYTATRGDLVDNLEQVTAGISGQLDSEVRQLSLISERIVFSGQIRDTIINLLPVSSGAERYRLTGQLDTLVYSVCGPKLTFYHMNIVTNSGYEYAFGQEYNYTKLAEAPQELPWYQGAVEQDGKVYVSPLHTSDAGGVEKPVISVCRGFGVQLGLPARAVVEMQRDYTFLAEMLEKAAYLDESQRETRAVYVFGQSGELIYPLGLPAEEQEHYRALLERDDVFDSHSLVKNPATGNGELLFRATGEFSGWRVVVAAQESLLLRPLENLVVQSVIIGILLLAAAAFVSYYLSRRITIPLESLNASVQAFRLEDAAAQDVWQTGSRILEVEQLGAAFNQMTQRLQDSLKKAVELKNAETHARMLALQAQMNPHFLYNTLAVINSMVDSGETQNVQWACRNLSNMLEYVSSESLTTVTFKEEMQHTLNYIDLILIRYPDDIDLAVDIPGDMLEVRMPKLMIQPLVENAVKYATEKPPVWHISLRCWCDEAHWYVRVEDDGSGFGEEKMAELLAKMEELRQGGKPPALSLKGMGLLNIYMRLYYTYQDEMVFIIDNRPGEGAAITVGGLL